MASFEGHALPGFMFIITAIWWAVNIFHRYLSGCSVRPADLGRGTASYKSRQPTQLSYYNTAMCRLRRGTVLPLEGIIKVVLVIIGIVMEMYGGNWQVTVSAGDFHKLMNWQHMTMYFMFGLHGLCDLLRVVKIRLPPNLSMFSLSLAFSSELILFAFHLHGRSELDKHLHILLAIPVAGCSAVTMIETFYPSNILLSILRIIFTLFQGTWFWQVGSILYPVYGDSWDEHSHHSMGVCTMLFIWHLAGDIFFIALIYIMVYYFMKCQGYEIEPNNEADTTRNGTHPTADPGDELLNLIGRATEMEADM